MAVFDELCELHWPSEFIIEYSNGNRERLLRGDGVCIMPPDDDPEGLGCLMASLPRRHPRNQKQGGRYISFTELRAVYSLEGRKLWPTLDLA